MNRPVRVHQHTRRRFVKAPAEHLTYFKPKSQFEISMQPSDFLNAVGPWSRESISEEGVKELMGRMEGDLEIDPLFLDVDLKLGKVVAHEGRHRAIAAERLGIETLPVLVYLYTKGEGYQEATPKSIERAKQILGRRQ